MQGAVVAVRALQRRDTPDRAVVSFRAQFALSQAFLVRERPTGARRWLERPLRTLEALRTKLRGRTLSASAEIPTRALLEWGDDPRRAAEVARRAREAVAGVHVLTRLRIGAWRTRNGVASALRTVVASGAHVSNDPERVVLARRGGRIRTLNAVEPFMAR